MKPGLHRGQLTKWKDGRGFGFIQPVDGSQEVFLHISELKDSTRRPQVGDTIYYNLTTQDGKTRACNAFILGARGKPNSTFLSSRTTSSSVSQTASRHSLLWLEVLLLSILPVIGSIRYAWTIANPLPLILYPTMSVLTYVLYADDKSRAKRGNRRISERTLHLCELAGGWLGGFIAQRRLRHKSIKRSYQIEFWAIVVLHLVFWVVWLSTGKTLLR